APASLSATTAQPEQQAPPDVHREGSLVDRRLDRLLESVQPRRLVRQDLRGGRRLTELTQVADLGLRHRQLDASFDDRSNTFGRHVARLPEQARRDRQAVEDVVRRIADDLVNRADVGPNGVDDLPAALDHEPGNRIGCQTARPPTYQTGPCVATGYESESARRISTSPVIPSSRSCVRSRTRIRSRR